jgi:hypothetical protein
MDKTEKRKRQHERPAQKQRRNQIVAVIVLVLIIGAGLAAWARFSAAQNAPGKLVGRWTRPDGGYVLDIRHAEANGRLDVAYLNPRPIHVAQANLSQSNGQWQVFVELRDVNYPGATYRLTYLPDQDQLAGQYHQPLMEQTFDVVFVRTANQSPAP